MRLGDCATFVNGYAFKPSDWGNKGKKIVRIQNLTGTADAYNYYDGVLDEKFIIKKGDILISWSASIGVYEWDDEDAYLNQHIFKVVFDKKEFDKNYFKYYISSKINELLKNVHGSTMKHITKNDFNNIEIEYIPLKEQQKVVKRLNIISEAKKNRKQQLADLDLLIKSSFADRFNDINETSKIGEHLDICRGASPRPIDDYITNSPDGINWIKIGDTREDDIYINNAKEKITIDGSKKSRVVKPGDFILSNSMSFGRPYILNIDGCVHDGWLILSNYEKTFNKIYLYCALRSEYVQSQFNGKASGAVVKNLNSDIVRNTMIKVPTIEAQENFANFYLNIMKIQNNIKADINDLDKLLSSLVGEL